VGREKKKTAYVLTLNERQARITAAALEEYFRLRMGQFEDLSNEIAASGENVHDPNDPEHSRKFNDYIDRRDLISEKLREVVRIAWPRGTVGRVPTEAYVAGDIWRVIRYTMAWHEHPQGGDWVDFAMPIIQGDEPLAECVAREDNGNAKEKR
jgi:hypothetical protein